MIDPQSCSARWADPALPVWGTAPTASFWVVLEQNGPWGNRAWTQSGLPRELGAAIEQATVDHGGRGLLIRNPAAHAHADGPRRVYLAGGLGGRPWLLAGRLTDPVRLLDLPFPALGAGSAGDVMAAAPWLAEQNGGVLLVCANGRRDPCCARLGGPLGRHLLAAHPGRVWESSHLGGHRFAPTALVLPTGQVLGRLTPALAQSALRAAGEGALVSPGAGHDRGRSHLAPHVQVADAFARAEKGTVAPTAFAYSAEDGSQVLVRDLEAGSVRGVMVGRREIEPRPESCGAGSLPAAVWTACWRDR